MKEPGYSRIFRQKSRENGSGAEDGQEKSGADPQTDPQLQAAVDYLLEM